MINFKDLKIGDKVDKNSFGDFNLFEKNPRLVKISWQFYDDCSGNSLELKTLSKDYEEILEEDEDE
jgi:hypothetical protein